MTELQPETGEWTADLYAGAGLFTVALAHAVGPRGRVVAVERNRLACEDLARNTSGLTQVETIRASVDAHTVGRTLNGVHLVVLDPARRGAGQPVMRALSSLDPPPRKVAYVSCDPSSFARDLRTMLDHGWSARHTAGVRFVPHDRARGAGGDPRATPPAWLIPGRARSAALPAGGPSVTGQSVTRPLSGRLVLSPRAWSSSGRRCPCRSGQHRLLGRLALGHPNSRRRPFPAGDTPSAIAKQVCQQEAQADIASALGEKAAVSTPTCGRPPLLVSLQLPLGFDGPLDQRAVSWAQTFAYFKSLAFRWVTPFTGQSRPGAFQTTNGSVVVRKDWKILLVDITGLPAPVRCAADQLGDVAVTVSDVILGAAPGD